MILLTGLCSIDTNLLRTETQNVNHSRKFECMPNENRRVAVSPVVSVDPNRLLVVKLSLGKPL